MNGAAVLFTNFGFSIKKILAIIIATLLLILMFPILAISSLGLPAMSFLANAPSAKAAEERGFYNGGVMPGNTYAWGNCTWWAYAMPQVFGIGLFAHRRIAYAHQVQLPQA